MAAAQAAEQLGKSCDLLIESVCTGNTAQAETEKTEFLHYAAVQPDPNAVLLALLAPATATVVIIKAITIINDMYIPYLYMPKNKLRTLTTFLMDYANAHRVRGRPWRPASSSSCCPPSSSMCSSSGTFWLASPPVR